MKIGIIGSGFLINTTKLFENKDVICYIYDIEKNFCFPKDITLEIIDEECELIFVCLPTAMKFDGSCDTNLIYDIIAKLINPYIIIRTTVPVHFCKDNKLFFMPEFTTETNWYNDFVNNKHWIYGLIDHTDYDQINIEFKYRIKKLINLAFDNNCIRNNDTRFITTSEAEMINIIKNSYLSSKVSFFNEIYNLCEKLNINYNNLINILKLDDAIGRSHLQILGPDNLRVYSDSLLKDTNNLYDTFSKNNLHSTLIESNLYKNQYKNKMSQELVTKYTNNKPIDVIINGNNEIGDSLLNELFDKDHNIIFVDTDINNIKNKEKYNYSQNFIFKKHNISNKLFIPHAHKVYFIINDEINDTKTIKINTIGIINIMKFCKKNNCILNILNKSSDSNHISNKIINIYTHKYNIICNYQ